MDARKKVSPLEALIGFLLFAITIVVVNMAFGDKYSLPRKSVEEYARQHCGESCSEERIQEITNEARELLEVTYTDDYVNLNGVRISKDRIHKLGKNEDIKEALGYGFKPVRKVNGDKMVNRHGEICYMRTPIAKDITEANRKMYEETGREMNPTLCTRPNEQQAVLYVIMKPQGDEVALPGRSTHNFGVGIDIANWQAAATYMADIGMIGGCSTTLVDDESHYQYGMSPESDLIAGTCSVSPGLANVARKAKKKGRKAKEWVKKKLSW